MGSKLELDTQHDEIERDRLKVGVSSGFRWNCYPAVSTSAQVILDFLTVLIGNAVAYGLYLELDVGKHHVDPSFYGQVNVLTSLGAVLVFSCMGVYRETAGLVNIEETRRLIRAVFYTSFAVFVGSFFVREYSFSRITASLAVPVNLSLLYVQRWATSSVHGALHREGVGVRRCLIYGVGEIGISIAKRFFQNPQLGWLPVGFLDRDSSQIGESYRVTPGLAGRQIKVLGQWEDLAAVVRNHRVTDIVMAVAADEIEQIVGHVTLLCQRLGVHCHFIHADTHRLWPTYELRNLDGLPLFSPRENRFSPYDLLKLVFDFVVSCILLILVFPLWLLIAMLIKYDSPGPLLFLQKRIGLDEREFTIYKFRTMHVHTPPYAVTPSSNGDSRITRVGKFLRRTSLDELPQLLNVLKGDMSLVGPRPEMPFIVATYNEYQRQRLAVKPGITGLWQISGDRAFQIHENIEYDLYYIANRSLSLDLAILFQTVFSVARGVGAC